MIRKLFAQKKTDIIFSIKNLLVEEHLMRIEIKRLRGLLNSKADNVMNLETRRLQLQTVMNNLNNLSIFIYLFMLLKNVEVKSQFINQHFVNNYVMKKAKQVKYQHNYMIE